MKKIVAMLVLIAILAVPASAAHYGIDVGAIQGSVSRAVEQEVQRNPDWWQDWVSQLLSRWRV